MKVERTFLIQVVQVFEGDPPGDWDVEDVNDYGYLDGDQDQYICDNWKLISDETELLDNDQLETRVLT